MLRLKHTHIHTYTQFYTQTHMVSMVCDASMKHSLRPLIGFAHTPLSTAQLHDEICMRPSSQSGRAQVFPPWRPYTYRPMESVRGSICAASSTTLTFQSCVVMCIGAWTSAALYSLRVLFPPSLNSGGPPWKPHVFVLQSAACEQSAKVTCETLCVTDYTSCCKCDAVW